MTRIPNNFIKEVSAQQLSYNNPGVKLHVVSINHMLAWSVVLIIHDKKIIMIIEYFKLNPTKNTYFKIFGDLLVYKILFGKRN